MHDHVGAMRCLTAAAVALAMLTCAVGNVTTVDWRPSVNYTRWAAHHRFYVGDWLKFVFEKNYYEVLEVKKSKYERCDYEDFVKNITKGGRDVYELTEARSYYFLSSGGYCYNGMKLAIHVRRSPPESTTDVKSVDNGAPPSDGVAVVLFMAMAAISTFVFKLL